MRIFILFLLMCANLPAATYYIGANGADTNNGTAKGTPWLHAPGMTNCASSCASATIAAGDSLIFRGGDTWHRSASTSDSTDVPMGGMWTWSTSGTSGSCTYPSPVSTCVYIGVDKTWFGGSSFARPIISMDNPIYANSTHKDGSHTGFVTDCTYDDTSITALKISANYVILDNFEFFGKCWKTVPTYSEDSEITRNAVVSDTITNCYFHGWTELYNPQASGSAMDQAVIIADVGGGTQPSHNVVAYNVVDGSDTICTGTGACTGGPLLYLDAYDYHGNVCRYIAECVNSPTNAYTAHDNLFEYDYESYDPAAHGALYELYGDALASSTPLYFYNNIQRNTNIGIGWSLLPTDGGTVYFFNNVAWGNGNPTNCIYLSNFTSTAITFNIYNNTLDAPCTVRFTGAGEPVNVNATGNFENNHFIGYASAALTSVYSIDTGMATIHDNGSEVYQTEAVATGQGYTTFNNYAPTTAGNATVGAGAFLTSSCSTFSSDSALCSGTSGGVLEGAGNVASYPAITINGRPSAAAWNSGAYQYLANTAPAPGQFNGIVFQGVATK